MFSCREGEREREREKQWDTSGVWKTGIIAHIIHIRLVPRLCPLIVPAHFISVEVSAAGAAGGGYAPLQASALRIYRKGFLVRIVASPPAAGGATLTTPKLTL